MSNHIHRSDWKYIPKDPEPGFSPERNKRIIEDTIQKYEKTRARKLKEFQDNLAERSDAVATYLTSRYMGSSPTAMERYFGRRNLAYLRGDQIREKLQRLVHFGTNEALIKKIEKKLKVKADITNRAKNE
jgi:hypothetical protein